MVNHIPDKGFNRKTRIEGMRIFFKKSEVFLIRFRGKKMVKKVVKQGAIPENFP